MKITTKRVCTTAFTIENMAELDMLLLLHLLDTATGWRQNGTYQKEFVKKVNESLKVTLTDVGTALDSFFDTVSDALFEGGLR